MEALPLGAPLGMMGAPVGGVQLPMPQQCLGQGWPGSVATTPCEMRQRQRQQQQQQHRTCDRMSNPTFAFCQTMQLVDMGPIPSPPRRPADLNSSSLKARGCPL